MKKAEQSVGILERLREEMKKRGLSAVIVPSDDDHMSEYVSERNKRIQALSGFSGSAGTAVVTNDQALLWTDGRYWIQAEAEMKPLGMWKLMKDRADGTPTVAEWIARETTGLVGIDSSLVSFSEANSLRSEILSHSSPCGRCCGDAGGGEDDRLVLMSPGENIVDAVWPEREKPRKPSTVVRVLPDEITGERARNKLAALGSEMAKRGAGAFVVTALDELAWLLNIRASDVPCSPLAEAFAIVHAGKGGVELFIDSSQVAEETVIRHLREEASVVVRPYESVYEHVSRISSAGAIFWCDPAHSNAALVRSIQSKALLEPSTVRAAKMIKNEAEIAGIRRAHLLDAVAAAKWLAWLAGVDRAGLTEFAVVEMLEVFRRRIAGYAGPSFETIAGFGENGAIIHYEPSATKTGPVCANGVMLLDFGGQYSCGGTTDTSRTVFTGPAPPTAEQKAHFTSVLRAHIALASAVFPDGTSPVVLDAIARGVMWKSGLEYRHGTGHGVGAFLGVHESPILSSSSFHEPKVQKGMALTIEPGVYIQGKHGVRIESVGIVVDAAVQPSPECSSKRFLQFDIVTRVPISQTLVEPKMMTREEIAWLNEFNRKCAADLVPLLSDDPKALEWVNHETRPIVA